MRGSHPYRLVSSGLVLALASASAWAQVTLREVGRTTENEISAVLSCPHGSLHITRGEPAKVLVLKAEEGSRDLPVTLSYVIRNRVGYLEAGLGVEELDGGASFQRGTWTLGFTDELPLRLWEDPELRTGPNGRDAWLRGWHTESEWMNAVHRCTYSNAVIGLHEQFRRFAYAETPAAKTRDEALLRRLEERRRRLAEADMVVFARIAPARVHSLEPAARRRRCPAGTADREAL